MNLLSGLVHCAICSRRMQGSWNHGQSYYRCKFPAEYALTDDRHPKAVYVKEASILPALDDWLAGLFTDERIESTCAALAASLGPDPGHEGCELAVRRKIKECDAELAQYRKTLEAGGDPSVISRWIDERSARAQSQRTPAPRQRGDNRMTGEEIRSLVEQLRGIVSSCRTPTLRTAERSTRSSTCRSTTTPTAGSTSRQVPARVLTSVSEGGLERPSGELRHAAPNGKK
ncbi:MAG TPA: zinc ribbon domain-containing protein [Acidimicrobiales bacterium]|nr:zinc ribbon domain-containing protein [Acidimicrobiales bacterium]